MLDVDLITEDEMTWDYSNCDVCNNACRPDRRFCETCETINFGTEKYHTDLIDFMFKNKGVTQ